MNKLITLVLLFFSTFLFAQIPAGYKSVKDTLAFKQKMEAQSKLVNTIESDFTQEKYLSVMSEKIITKGHFLFKKVKKEIFDAEVEKLQKGAKDFLKVIQLYIDKTDYAVVKVKMIEPSDDYTMIDFSNRKTNQPIGDEKFIVK